MTPGRLQYLDKVWQAYQTRYGQTMPVDIWNMHLYILPEANKDGVSNGIASIALGTDPALAIRESGGNPNLCSDPLVYCYAEHDDLAIFAQQVVAMRTWMKQHGQQDKPLIISEYSILYPYDIVPGGCYVRDEYGNCFTPQRVSTFMTTDLQLPGDRRRSGVGLSTGWQPPGATLDVVFRQLLWSRSGQQPPGEHARSAHPRRRNLPIRSRTASLPREPVPGPGERRGGAPQRARPDRLPQLSLPRSSTTALLAAPHRCWSRSMPTAP